MGYGDNTGRIRINDPSGNWIDITDMIDNYVFCGVDLAKKVEPQYHEPGVVYR